MSSTSRRRAIAAGSIVFSLALGLAPAAAVAQDPLPALDHEDTYRWNEIDWRVLSDDGRWLAYVLEPWDGDPTLVVTRTDGSLERRFRGDGARFTRDGRYLAFRIRPLRRVVDSLKLEGKTGDDLPKDSLGVVDLAAMAAGGVDEEAGVFRAGPVESFDLPEEGGAWIAYLMAEEPEDAADEAKRGAEEAEAEEEPAGGQEAPATPGEERSPEYEKRHKKEDGTRLVLRLLDSGAEHGFDHAVSYAIAEGGQALAYVASTKAEGDDGLFVVDPRTGAATEALSGEGHYLQLAFDEAGERLAFLSNKDDWGSEQPSFALYRATGGAWRAQRLAGEGTSGLSPGWWVSEHGDVSFSVDGSRIFFGTAPRPAPEPEEKILDEDRVRVDVWNWRDDYLQPMQLVQAERERDRSYMAVWHEGADRLVQLATPAIPDVSRTEDGLERFVLGTTDIPYRQALSWDGRYQDAYAIDVRTGTHRRLATGVRGFGGADLSPGGTYALWWDEAARDWKSRRMDGTAGALSLTGDLPVAFHDELDDHPQGPPPYGRAVWTERDAAVLLYDRHDVWRADPSGATAPVRLTDGRDAGLRYRAIPLDQDSPGGFQGFGRGRPVTVPNGDVLLSVFDLSSRAGGFARGRSDRAAAPRSLVMGDVRYGTPRKAKDADALLWTRESFVEFPDLWVSDTSFSGARKLSDANPQQAEYRWGTAELVSWTSNDGVPLEGILIKPDGFDPSRRYPMMVYLYERLSDALHQYQPPVPNRASIRHPFYASRGYLVFVPDIPYEIGYPGESALDAVVPGVLSLIERGFVDNARIGVQGHSWGGYQIAYMITKTNLFAAAEAGAPVSNMTSAYGGIRWQTGMSRMFQYERTQSRIGGTLWEARDRYIHNSPVFFADKIETPLLMLHNDEDGAVPWYQGIEMFVAMRRLGKPVFMLNYNGEAHGLTREVNRADWAIRMQQFFDHYLLDAPAPVWMASGVPAVLKGRDLGLELVETASTVSEQEQEGAGPEPRKEGGRSP